MKNQVVEIYEKLKESQEMVGVWNGIAGKLENISNEDIENQYSRVVEEVDEYFLHKKSFGENRSSYKLLMDDICDIFVTAAFYNQMKNIPFPSYDDCITIEFTAKGDLLKNVENMLGLNDGIDTYRLMLGITSLAMTIELTKNDSSIMLGGSCTLFDVIGGIDAVILNNYTKFIEVDEMNADYRVSQTIKRYGEDKVKVLESSGFLVIMNKCDNKIRKPYGYEPVDLSPFVW